MHNPEPVLENETQKLLWVFDILIMEPLILARRPDLVVINNKKKKKKKRERTCRIVDFAVLTDHRAKMKERPCWRIEKKIS